MLVIFPCAFISFIPQTSHSFVLSFPLSCSSPSQFIPCCTFHTYTGSVISSFFLSLILFCCSLILHNSIRPPVLLFLHSFFLLSTFLPVRSSSIIAFLYRFGHSSIPFFSQSLCLCPSISLHSIYILTFSSPIIPPSSFYLSYPTKYTSLTSFHLLPSLCLVFPFHTLNSQSFHQSISLCLKYNLTCDWPSLPLPFLSYIPVSPFHTVLEILYEGLRP